MTSVYYRSNSHQPKNLSTPNFIEIIRAVSENPITPISCNIRRIRRVTVPPLVRMSRQHLRKVTHCVFDLDGTLLDTEVMYHKAVRKICEIYGKKYSIRLEDQLYGGTDQEIHKRVVQSLRLPISVDEFEAQMADFNKNVLPKAPLKKGAERLLTHLHHHNVPMALATNSTDEAVRLCVAERPQFFSMFHHKVCVTDAKGRSKPHPDLYLIAASRFPDKPNPEQCLVFEDSAVGVQAAVRAGMQVVLITEKRQRTRQATLVLPSLMEFQPELFGLPAFDKPKV